MLYLAHIKHKQPLTVLGRYDDSQLDLVTSLGKGVVKHDGVPMGIFLVRNKQIKLIRTIRRKGYLKPRIMVT